MQDTITNRPDGTVQSVTGRGVTAFRLRAIMIALRFKQKTGQELDRRFPALKTAKATTGLRTNDIGRQIDRLAFLMQTEIDACTVTTTPEAGQ